MYFFKKIKPKIKILDKKFVNKKYLSWLNNKTNQQKIDLNKKITLSELKSSFYENKRKGNKLHGIFYNNIHIGNINIIFLNKTKCYIGYLIGEKKNKSKGIGTYAVNLAIKKCFEFYKVSEIYSLSQTSNEPSCRLLKKNNFIPLNTRPKYFKKYIKKISVKYFILKKKNFKKIHFLEKN